MRAIVSTPLVAIHMKDWPSESSDMVSRALPVWAAGTMQSRIRSSSSTQRKLTLARLLTKKAGSSGCFTSTRRYLRTAASLTSGKQVSLPAFANPVIDDRELALQMCRLHAVLETEQSLLTRQELFLMTFAELARRHGDVALAEPRRGHERTTVRRVREYLDANTRRNVALEDLSELSGLSAYHLIRVFRQEWGLSPHAYFEQVRIHRARRLLKEGVPIADVAADLGFTDQSHLTRHFKKRTGVTPGAYRSATTYKTGTSTKP